MKLAIILFITFGFLSVTFVDFDNMISIMPTMIFFALALMLEHTRIRKLNSFDKIKITVHESQIEHHIIVEHDEFGIYSDSLDITT